MTTQKTSPGSTPKTRAKRKSRAKPDPEAFSMNKPSGKESKRFDLDSVKSDVQLNKLLGYQSYIIEDDTPCRFIKKGRRTGISYAFAFKAVCKATLGKADGGSDVHYMVHTVEDAKAWLEYCRFFAKAMNQILKADDSYVPSVDGTILPENVKKGDEEGFAHKIKFASGHEIRILANKTDRVRGTDGMVIFDEAASLDNLWKKYEAASGLMMQGGQVVFISTVKGIDNEFYQMCDLCDENPQWRLFELSFDFAMEHGYFERIGSRDVRLKKFYGRGEDPEAKADFVQYQKDIAAKPEIYDQEWQCIPNQSSSSYFPAYEIRKNQEPGHIYKALHYDRETDKIEPWIDKNIAPISEAISSACAGEMHMGSDFGSEEHPTSIAILDKTGGKKVIRAIIDIYLMPGVQQIAVHNRLIKALDIKAACCDGNGSGKTTYSEIRRLHGSRFHDDPVISKWHQEQWPLLLRALELSELELPDDRIVMTDLMGVHELPDGRIKLLSSRRGERHYDSAIAIALANQSSTTQSVDISWADRAPVRFRPW